jgi:hypothetical protein
MSDEPTTTVARDSGNERQWSSAPAFTLLAVIVLWYMGVAALILGHAL